MICTGSPLATAFAISARVRVIRHRSGGGAPTIPKAPDRKSYKRRILDARRILSQRGS